MTNAHAHHTRWTVPPTPPHTHTHYGRRAARLTSGKRNSTNLSACTTNANSRAPKSLLSGHRQAQRASAVHKNLAGVPSILLRRQRNRLGVTECNTRAVGDHRQQRRQTRHGLRIVGPQPKFLQFGHHNLDRWFRGWPQHFSFNALNPIVDDVIGNDGVLVGCVGGSSHKHATLTVRPSSWLGRCRHRRPEATGQ